MRMWLAWAQMWGIMAEQVPNTVTVDQYVQTGVVTERPRPVCWSSVFKITVELL